MLRAALLQLSSSDSPADNAGALRDGLRQAASAGAALALAPEAANCISASRAHQRSVLADEAHDPVLSALCATAAETGLWALAGLVLAPGPGRFVNRAVLAGPDGRVHARYDKIHMFDVDIEPEAPIRESDAFAPGHRAVLAQAAGVPLGLTICYDMRFPHLFRRLAKAGARVIAVPSAFHPVTGAAHWETLLRARAIETGAFVLAPAQSGRHRAISGRARESHGHSLAVAPWGEVLADAGTVPGVTVIDLDLEQVAAARRRVPALLHDAAFAGP